MRWIIRFIGLISTVIVARILSPEDYGLVAMAMITVGILRVFSDMGIDLSLVRHPDPRREHYDTAWTFQLLLGCIVSLLIFLAAPLASDYFNEEKVEGIMRLLAISPILQGLSNIGVVDFRRELNFQKEFKFNLVKKLVGVPVTIGFAIALQNYYALVFGIIAGNLAETLVSYYMHGYRPRFSFAAFAELLSFSLWLFVRNLAVYLRAKADQLVVGRIAGGEALGVYYIAVQLARSFTMEMAVPVGRALLPGYAKIQGDQSRLKFAFPMVLGGLSFFLFPLMFGLASVSDVLIPLLLGDQWRESSQFFSVLVFAFGASALTTAAGPMLIAMGKVKPTAVIRVVQLVLLASVLFPLVYYSDVGLLGIALIVTGIEWLTLPVFLTVACKVSGLRYLYWLGVMIRPALAAAGFFFVLLLLERAGIASPYWMVFSKVMIGVLSYAALVLFLWYLWGRPSGVEQLLIDFLRRRLSAGRC